MKTFGEICKENVRKMKLIIAFSECTILAIRKYISVSVTKNNKTTKSKNETKKKKKKKTKTKTINKWLTA